MTRSSACGGDRCRYKSGGALETYSVLTRLPAPHRASDVVVREFLKARFPEPFLRLSAGAYREFLSSLPDRGVSGGADHGAELVSCDRRAAIIYERYSVRTRIV